MSRELRNAACMYASWGWHVHPLVPRSKRPLTEHGKDDATSDLAQVLSWWQEWPDANIGIHCHASGLLVIDVDPRNGGDDTFWELERELGELHCPTATTGGGGMHYYFRHPDENVVGKLGEGVDVKSRGYVLAWPSIHPSGQPYMWERWGAEGKPANLPPAWLQRVIARPLDPARERNVNHGDSLRDIPAEVYIYQLTGRETDRRGWVQCPFHKGGQERTPSLQVKETVWACFACDPPPGRRVMGGNIYQFAGALWGYPLPVDDRGHYIQIASRLEQELGT